MMTNRLMDVAAVCALLFAATSEAVEIVPVENRTNGRNTVLAMKKPSEAARVSVLSLHEERTPFALATVVGDGLAVTKASELEGKANVFAQDARRRKGVVTVVAIDDENDLALLRVEKLEVSPVKWMANPGENLPIASVVSGSTPRIGRMRIGLRSAESRAVKSRGATLGITAQQKMEPLDEAQAKKEGVKERALGIEVKEIIPDGPADQAGLKVGDLLTMINDAPTLTMDALVKVMAEISPGADLVLKVTRGEEKLELEMLAGSPSDTLDKFNRNQQMSGRTSRRKSGFSMVMQSDIPLPPDAMGGPLFALDGSAVGVLIAHADRVTTYVLPADVVQARVEEMLKEKPE